MNTELKNKIDALGLSIVRLIGLGSNGDLSCITGGFPENLVYSYTLFGGGSQSMRPGSKRVLRTKDKYPPEIVELDGNRAFPIGIKGEYMISAFPLDWECGLDNKEFKKLPKSTQNIIKYLRGVKRMRKRKVNLEKLQSLVWKKPLYKIAEEMNVTTAALVYWCKKLEMPKPPRGYWKRSQVRLLNNLKDDLTEK